ncbi:MAG TPA: DUF1844 domain-containing protein [Acidobacteriota bacterium]|nr:DUF1844 domain-containing protein [Acidobacteriota bacterium]
MSENEGRRGDADGGDEIKVEDRRRIDPRTGDARGADEVPLPGGGVLRGAEDEAAGTPPAIFAELVNPFLLLGLAGLGVLPHPETNKPEVNLAVAQRAIECLELLARKTEGRLEPDEDRLLQQALYELKMQFVEARERPRRG